VGGDDDVLQGMGSVVSIAPSEKRRIGKVYKKEEPLERVVAAEMARIRQAFDAKLVDHTEELV